jgi:dTDP-4-amino-4,6-dideoxygalactose transaminase
LKLDQISKSQREVFTELHAAGIGVNLHYIPVYRQPYYEQLGFKAGHCPESEKYYAEVLSLPMYPMLTNKKLSYVTSSLSKFIC